MTALRKKSQLTPRQRRMLTLLLAKRLSNFGQAPPSLRDLAVAFGTRSIQGTIAHLDALQKKGCLRRDDAVRGTQRVGLGYVLALAGEPDGVVALTPEEGRRLLNNLEVIEG